MAQYLPIERWSVDEITANVPTLSLWDTGRAARRLSSDCTAEIIHSDRAHPVQQCDQLRAEHDHLDRPGDDFPLVDHSGDIPA